MKSRQLNKLYQLMRVSRVFQKRRASMNGVPGMKKVLNSFDDKIDDLLIRVFNQKESITYAARQKREIREELTKETLTVSLMASVYFLNVGDNDHYANVNFTYSDYKRVSEVIFPIKVNIVLGIVRKFPKELVPYGIRERNLQRIEELKKEYAKIVSLPRNLQCKKAANTDSIKKQLKELTKMQCKIIDNIAKSFFETAFLKNEYRKARKIVQHKNPEGMFDEMLRRYRGVKRKRISRKQVLKNILKNELAGVKE
jgi:hypothetical protein